MSSKNFTKVDNRILDDPKMSFEAKGVYTILVRQYLIPGFKLYKIHIQKLAGLGETRFNRAWKELKEKGVLTQVKKRIKGKFVYEYTLQTAEKKETEPVKEETKKPIDSDGNKPMEGQLYIDDVANKKDNKVTTEEHKNIKSIINITKLDKSQCKELLNMANNNLSKVIKSYKYVISQPNVKDIFNYTKWAIQNNKTLNVNPVKNKFSNSNIEGHFNNFEQRQYNFKALEAALLGEQYKSLYN